jgi:hypothetical protein
LITKVFENNAEFESSYQFGSDTKISYGDVEFIPSFTMTLEEARMIASLMSGTLMYNGNLINTELLEDGSEKVIIGKEEFIILRDENGNVLSIINSNTGEVKTFNPGSMESHVQNMYDLYVNGNISQEDWNEYCASLSIEEKGFLDCLMTNAFVVEAKDVVSVVGDINDQHYLPLIGAEHTGKEIFTDVDCLFRENLYELNVMSEYSMIIETDMETATAAFEAGYIDEDTYDAIISDCNSKLEVLNQQMILRGDLNNQLISGKKCETSTFKDNLYEAVQSGNIELANQYILEINSSTTDFIPLSTLVSDSSIFGDNVVVQLYELPVYNGNFGSYKSVATVENACTLKNSTFWGAYSYAVGTNQTYISPDNPDVVYFSSYDYLDYGGKYYTDSPQIQVERSYLMYVNTLSFDSVPGVKMDSVYIRSLDAYCTIDQYNNYLENGIIVQNEDGTIELGDVHE